MFSVELLTSKIPELTIFIFIIAGNYVGDIFSCTLRHLFNESMILKHVLSFFILFVFVGMIGDKVDNVMDSFLISFVLYCVFVFTMRSHYIVSLTTIAMLLVIYIVTRLQSDPNITQERQNRLKKYKKMLFIITTVLATLGFIYQIVKCMFIFGKDWSFGKFLLGLRDQECFLEENKRLFYSEHNTGFVDGPSVPFKMIKRGARATS